MDTMERWLKNYFTHGLFLLDAIGYTIWFQFNFTFTLAMKPGEKIKSQRTSQVQRGFTCAGIEPEFVSLQPGLPCISAHNILDKPETDIYFYHTDHLGSSAFISDLSGTITQHLQYLPFGEQFIEQRYDAPYFTPYKFSAKEKDEETQYSYFGARYYISDISVWLSVDPMADKYPSLSPFMYCAGNPVILVDPDGRALTDYQLKKDGQIVRIGAVNNEPDRLFNHNKSEYETINDKKILPQLVTNQKKIQIVDSSGDIIGHGYKSKSSTRNTEDAAKVLDFMSRNSDAEWAIYATNDKNYHIGTLGLENRAPSPLDLGINSNDVKTMIHSHIKGSEKDEVGSLYGDRLVSPDCNYNYYTYYGISKNLYKINKNNTYSKAYNVKDSDIVRILKQD